MGSSTTPHTFQFGISAEDNAQATTIIRSAVGVCSLRVRYPSTDMS